MFAIIDCNSFYCSCERLFKPQLQNMWPEWAADNRWWISPLEDRVRPDETFGQRIRDSKIGN